MSQQEVKTGIFIEDVERADINGPSVRVGKKRGPSLVSLWGLGVFTEGNGLVYVSSQASRNQLERR